MGAAARQAGANALARESACTGVARRWRETLSEGRAWDAAARGPSGDGRRTEEPERSWREVRRQEMSFALRSDESQPVTERRAVATRGRERRRGARNCRARRRASRNDAGRGDGNRPAGQRLDPARVRAAAQPGEARRPRAAGWRAGVAWEIGRFQCTSSFTGRTWALLLCCSVSVQYGGVVV